MSDIKEWYYGIPPVTRFIFSVSFGLTVIANFYPRLIPMLLLDADRLWYKFELWRLVTPFFFYGGLGFPFLINMLFLYQYSRLLEEETFSGKRAEYVFMLLVCAGVLLPVGLLWPFAVLSISLLLAIVYVWANLNKDRMVSFFFGLRFKAMYFPWVLMAFNILMGGYPLLELVGVVAGHVYYFLQYVYPETSGRRLMECPDIIRRYFPDDRVVQSLTGAYNRAPTSNEQRQQPRNHAWGRGERLGS